MVLGLRLISINVCFVPIDKLCETKTCIRAAAVNQSGSKTADLNIAFLCQLFWINVQKASTISDCISPTIYKGNHNRKGRETNFSRQGSLNRPECDATTRCCILNNGHSCVQWPISPTAEWSHFNSSFSACIHPHLTQSNTFTPLHWGPVKIHSEKEIKLTKTRCWRRVSTSKTLISHAPSITDWWYETVSKTQFLL